MQVIHVDSKCVVNNEDCARNLEMVLARNYLHCRLEPARSGKLAVVASGPSVPDYLDELRDWPGEIWTVNGAYHYLLENGIVPHGFAGVDPLPGLKEYITDPHPDTIFYLSGLCDPTVFDTLPRDRIRVWFPTQDDVTIGRGLPQIPGGTSVLTRTPFLAHMLGWRDVTLYGCDSSHSHNSRYAYGSGKYREDSGSKTASANNPVMRVICDGKEFFTELPLIKQVSQLGVIADWKEIKLTYRCGGLLAAYMAAPMSELPPDTELVEKFTDDASAA